MTCQTDCMSRHMYSNTHTHTHSHTHCDTHTHTVTHTRSHTQKHMLNLCPIVVYVIVRATIVLAILFITMYLHHPRCGYLEDIW